MYTTEKAAAAAEGKLGGKAWLRIDIPPTLPRRFVTFHHDRRFGFRLRNSASWRRPSE
jgi:hypothetical protein